MLNRLAQLREKREAGDRGFTLIELLVVVVIIGILIAIAIPLYLNYRRGANDKAAQSDLRNAVNTLEQCNTDNSGYPSALGTLAANVYPVTGCSAQSLNVSDHTTFTYTAYANADGSGGSCSTAPCAAYQLVSSNSAGTSGKSYTYKSWVGGKVG